MNEHATPSASLLGEAYISECGLFRYSLTRNVAPLTGEGTCTFVMLNPSTADAEQDDPTIRRCIGYARKWGYARLKVVNLYAFRATDPADLFDSMEAGIRVVGPENDAVIARVFGGSDLIVAAWGANARADRLAQFAETFGGWRLHALALTKDGQPRHPLYLRGDLDPFVWEIRARAAA